MPGRSPRQKRKLWRPRKPLLLAIREFRCLDRLTADHRGTVVGYRDGQVRYTANLGGVRES